MPVPTQHTTNIYIYGSIKKDCGGNWVLVCDCYRSPGKCKISIGLLPQPR